MIMQCPVIIICKKIPIDRHIDGNPSCVNVIDFKND